MRALKGFWRTIKRNPVIVAFFVAIATQVFQDWQEGKIDWAHFWGYLVMVCFSVAARQLVTPVSDPKIESVDNVRGIRDGRNTL